MTLCGFNDSVMELVHFVGRLATVALQLEGCQSLLLNFILDFYETVSELMLNIILDFCLCLVKQTYFSVLRYIYIYIFFLREIKYSINHI